MNRIRVGLALSLIVVAAPRAAGAHHSTAMFEPERRVTLNGTIKDFQWTNPHAWIQIVVPGAGRQVGRLELRVRQPEHALPPRLEAVDVQAG